MNYWKLLFDAEKITEMMKDKYVGKITTIEKLYAFLESHTLWDYPMTIDFQCDEYGYILDIIVIIDKDRMFSC